MAGYSGRPNPEIVRVECMTKELSMVGNFMTTAWQKYERLDGDTSNCNYFLDWIFANKTQGVSGDRNRIQRRALNDSQCLDMISSLINTPVKRHGNVWPMGFEVF